MNLQKPEPRPEANENGGYKFAELVVYYSDGSWRKTSTVAGVRTEQRSWSRPVE